MRGAEIQCGIYLEIDVCIEVCISNQAYIHSEKEERSNLNGFQRITFVNLDFSRDPHLIYSFLSGK